ncbi:MAG: acyltransferase [Verrucomicrobia bacterium]|nr:acyltransferase [Verrucomicrobiota bacterium]
MRGLAILLVLSLHYFVQTKCVPDIFLSDPHLRILSRQGWSGVDLFFVLSGFLIGGILLDEGGRKGFLRAFFLRRALRILPVYLLLIAVVFGVMWFLERRPPHAFVEIPVWSYLLFVQNYYTAFGYKFSLQLGPFWSLAIEEQFYVLGALVRTKMPRWTAAVLLGTCLLGGPVLRVLLEDGRFHGLGWWDFTPARLDGLAFGVGVAWLLRQPAAVTWLAGQRGPHRWLILALSVALPLVSLIDTQRGLATPEGITFLGLNFAAIVAYLILHGPASRLGRALRFGPLRWFGRVSYFVYVFHMFLLSISAQLIGTFVSEASRTSIQAVALALLLLVAAAAVSWRWLESPLLRVGRSIPYGKA